MMSAFWNSYPFDFHEEFTVLISLPVLIFKENFFWDFWILWKMSKFQKFQKFASVAGNHQRSFFWRIEVVRSSLCWRKSLAGLRLKFQHFWAGIEVGTSWPKFSKCIKDDVKLLKHVPLRFSWRICTLNLFAGSYLKISF